MVQNYGAFYDLKPTGLVGGAVLLNGKGNNNINATTYHWSYKVLTAETYLKFYHPIINNTWNICTWLSLLVKVGLNGETQQFHDPNSRNANWKSTKVPKSRPMTWYKVLQTLNTFHWIISISCKNEFWLRSNWVFTVYRLASRLLQVQSQWC